MALLAANDNYVIAAFGSLSYLFVYNGAHEHVYTIRFYGTEIREHAENHELGMLGIPGIGLSTLWGGLDFMDADVITVAKGNRIFVIQILQGELFAHSAKVRFSRSAFGQSADDTVEYIRPEEWMLYEGHLYVSFFQVPH